MILPLLLYIKNTCILYVGKKIRATDTRIFFICTNNKCDVFLTTLLRLSIRSKAIIKTDFYQQAFYVLDMLTNEQEKIRTTVAMVVLKVVVFRFECLILIFLSSHHFVFIGLIDLNVCKS